MKDKDIVDAFSAIGVKEVGQKVVAIFERVQIAEEEIAAASRKIRSKKIQKALEDSFLFLRFSPPLAGFGSDLYRVHCRELLGRVMVSDSVDALTDAEVMAILSGMSQQAPLKNDAVALYITLFKKRFPERLPEISTRDVHESYAGAMSLIDNEIRRKLSRLVLPRVGGGKK